MINRSDLRLYYNYVPLEPFFWKEEPLIRMAFVFLFFALLFTFYFNNLILIGLILYLVAVVLPIFPIFNYLTIKEAHRLPPSDQQVDELFFHDLASTIPVRALKKLGYDPDQVEPENILMVPGPIYWKTATLSDSAIFRHMGRDGVYRYTAWEIMVLILTDKYVSIYECTFNWYGGNSVSDERTSEFFYNDIIAVKTQTAERQRELIGGGSISQVQVFKLLTLSGDSVEVEVNKNILGPQPQIGGYTDRAIERLRFMLREKKYKDIKMEVLRPEEDEEEAEPEVVEAAPEAPKPRRGRPDYDDFEDDDEMF